MTRPSDVAAKRSAFRSLHESGCFVIPNPWDIGSARYLAQLGFRALATTSAGAAWAMGLPDAGVTRDAMLAHIAAIVAATDLPVNADFEDGYATAPEAVFANVALAVATGVAGLSIEDSTAEEDAPLYELSLAIERIRAAREATRPVKSGVLLTGRAEGFLVGRAVLDDVVARLVAYAEAGADCLYAPGVRTEEDHKAIIAAVAPKPVNVLVGAPGWTVARYGEIGARRLSVGGSLARTAWGGFMRAAKEIAEEGTFGGLAGAPSFGAVNAIFVADSGTRAAAKRPA